MPLWLKIILGILGGFVIFAGAIVLVAFWLTSGLIEPIDRQIAALKTGDVTAAYAETSEAFQQATTFDGFVKFVEAHPILKDVASHNFSSRSIENNRGSVAGTLTSSTGGVTPATYQLIKEKSVWKIIHLELGGGAGASP